MKMTFWKKIFSGLLVVVLSTILGVLIILARDFAHELRERTESELHRIPQVIKSFEDIRFKKFLSEARVISRAPQLTLLLVTPGIPRGTIVDTAHTMQDIVGSDFFLITDDLGRLFVRLDDPRAVGQSLTGVRIVQDALIGKEATSNWILNDTIYRIVALPLKVEDRIVGSLVVGHKIDDVAAHELQSLIDCEIGFVLGEFQMVSKALISGYTRAKEGDPGVLARVEAERKNHLEALFAASPDMGLDGASFKIDVLGENYLAMVVPISNETNVQARFILMRSLEEALRFHKRIRWRLYSVGIMGILIALFLSVTIAQRLSKPIRRLVAVTKRISMGDMGAHADEHRTDEIGDLGKAFNEMTRSLKESRDQLEEYNRNLEKTVAERTRELSTANARLRELDQLKSQFLAHMSHELRTPLNVVIVSAELLVDKILGPLTEKQTQIAQSVYNNGKHLADLINDILDLSAIEAGQLRLRTEEIDLRDVITEIESLIHPQMQKKNLAMEVFPGPEPPLVVADKKRVKQVIINIVGNAMKYTPDGGKITFIIEDKDTHRELKIKDSGIGMKKDQLPFIFDEFRQAEMWGGHKTKEGTGLGLAISKKLVEAHSGKIWVDSQPGEGTTFGFTLPKAEGFIERLEKPQVPT